MRRQLKFGIGACFLGVVCLMALRGSADTRLAAKPSKAKGGVTFSKGVASLIYDKCSVCHHEGEVAPFSLTNYKEIKKHGQQIALITQKGIMPPWRAEHGFGEFLGERVLSDEQKQMLQDWVKAGMPEGNPNEAPKSPVFTKGWQNGNPDLVVESSQGFDVGASGDDVFQCFVIPTNYTEDRYISGVEVKPGNRSVVHHVLAFLDTSGQARKLDAADPSQGYSSYGGVGFLPSGVIAGWAPGNEPTKLPEGIGILLPKGADVVLQVHYHKSGKAEEDQTRVGLTFHSKPVDKRVRTAMVINPFFYIPAGAKAHEVRASTPLPGDVTLISVTPHMHLLGREMTVVAETPEGKVVPLVRVSNWNFNWQMTYGFKNPISVPKSTQLKLVAKYDNSVENPLNPRNPPKGASWGEQTTDEMCIAFVSYLVDSEHLTKGVEAPGFPDFGGAGRRRKK